MIKEAGDLYSALLSKEKTQSSLSSLEQLKANGAIGARKYVKKKTAYQNEMIRLVSAIATGKNQLRQRMQLARNRLSDLKASIDQINAKFASGNMSPTKYQSGLAILTEKQQSIRDEIEVVNKLLLVKSSQEVAIIKGKIGYGMPVPTSAVQAGGFPIRLITRPAKICGLIGGILLIISIFLPWLSVRLGFTWTDVAIMGIGLSLFLAVAGLIGGLISIATALFTKIRWWGVIEMVVGIAGCIALLTTWSLISGGLNNQEVEQEIMRQLIKTAVLREGFYLFILGAILCIIGGSLEMMRARR
jgi:hypothetical protein